MSAETLMVLKEGMQITKEELLAQGCHFVRTWGSNSEIFKKGFKEDDSFIYWDKDTKKIWRILPDN